MMFSFSVWGSLSNPSASYLSTPLNYISHMLATRAIIFLKQLFYHGANLIIKGKSGREGAPEVPKIKVHGLHFDI